MALVHRRRVGQHRGHGLANPDATLRERGGQAPAACVGLAPGVALRAMDYRNLLRIDVGGALEEGKGRERRVIGGILFEIVIKNRRSHEPSIAVRG